MTDFISYIESQLKDGKSLEDIGTAFAEAMNTVQETNKKREQEQLSIIEARKNSICVDVAHLFAEYLSYDNIDIRKAFTDENEFFDLIKTFFTTVITTINEIEKLNKIISTSKTTDTDAEIIKNFIKKESAPTDYSEEDMLEEISFLDKLIGQLADN